MPVLLLSHHADVARLLGASIGTATGASLVYNDMQKRLATLQLPKDILHTILNDPPSIQGSLKGVLPEPTRLTIIEHYVQSYRLLFWITTGCFLFAFVVSVTLLKHHPLVRADDDQQREAAKAWLQDQKTSKGQAKGTVDAEKGGEAVEAEK